jgi:hypothetical protein
MRIRQQPDALTSRESESVWVADCTRRNLLRIDIED